MSSNTKTVLLCGVGGQGTILAADLLARAAEESGLDVKVSEIHGMAQRGGAVTTVVRFGDKVQSMIADLGSADCVVSFETTEALRNLPYVKEGGSLFVNDESIKPLPVATGRASMPEHARMYGIGLSLPAFPRSISMSTSRRSNWVPRFPRNKREGVFL